MVISVAADEQIADAVQHESEGTENDASLVSVIVELFVAKVIVVLDVEERLDDFDDD